MSALDEIERVRELDRARAQDVEYRVSRAGGRVVVYASVRDGAIVGRGSALATKKDAAAAAYAEALTDLVRRVEALAMRIDDHASAVSDAIREAAAQPK